MSTEDFEKLREIVLSEPDLQKYLRKITDRETFIARVIAVGAERELNFNAQDVAEAMGRNRRSWIERWI